MSITKQFLKTKPLCKATFRISKEVTKNAKSVNLVGDFNKWDTSATPMKSLKNGDFKVTLDLEVNREYQYRYLIDKSNWENDWEADKYVPSEYGDCDNSVVVI